MQKIRMKGASVEDEGALREVQFYDGVQVIGDYDNALYYLRFKPDGSLEISTGGATVRHGGKLLDGKLVIRPDSSGTVNVRRDDYAG